MRKNETSVPATSDINDVFKKIDQEILSRAQHIKPKEKPIPSYSKEEIAERLLSYIADNCDERYGMIFGSETIEEHYHIEPEERLELFRYMSSIYRNKGRFSILYTKDAIIVLNMDRIKKNLLDFSDTIGIVPAQNH